MSDKMRCTECWNYEDYCRCYIYSISQGREIFDDEFMGHTDGNDYCPDCRKLDKGSPVDPHFEVCDCEEIEVK